jgi:hypothetical protein
VLGGGEDLHVGPAAAERGQREQPEGAAADEGHPAGLYAGGGVHGAGGRLDEHGGLVGQVVGYGDELGLVRHHQRRPPAAGALAEATLQPRLQVTEADALAAVDVAGRARGADGGDPAGHAAEHGDDHDAGPVVELADDLVPGGEREGDDRLEPPRRRAVDGG